MKSRIEHVVRLQHLVRLDDVAMNPWDRLTQMEESLVVSGMKTQKMITWDIYVLYERWLTALLLHHRVDCASQRARFAIIMSLIRTVSCDLDQFPPTCRRILLNLTLRASDPHESIRDDQVMCFESNRSRANNPDLFEPCLGLRLYKTLMSWFQEHQPDAILATAARTFHGMNAWALHPFDPSLLNKQLPSPGEDCLFRHYFKEQEEYVFPLILQRTL